MDAYYSRIFFLPRWMSSAIRLTWASVSHPHGIIVALRIPCHLPTFWFQRHCFDPYNISARACVSSAQNTLATSRFLRSRRKRPSSGHTNQASLHIALSSMTYSPLPSLWASWWNGLPADSRKEEWSHFRAFTLVCFAWSAYPQVLPKAHFLIYKHFLKCHLLSKSFINDP